MIQLQPFSVPEVTFSTDVVNSGRQVRFSVKTESLLEFDIPSSLEFVSFLYPAGYNFAPLSP